MFTQKSSIVKTNETSKIKKKIKEGKFQQFMFLSK